MDVPGVDIPAGIRSAALQLVQSLSKLAKEGCGVAEIPLVVTKAKPFLG